MSENMHERITEDLQEQPEMARTVFDDGWTLLQRDALGGNVVPVAALLAAGADREARTPAGDTALDLAKR
ncbi:MAG: ankyrin repeat domain-containing protein, partial [Stenotrophomonas sp.]